MTRTVALITRDPAIYAELAGTLRERHIPSVSLVPGQRIPESTAAVLTSVAEAGQISHPNVLAVSEDGDRTALWAAVAQALAHETAPDGLVVGLDPGPRPGYSILSGTACIGEGVLETPEAAGHLAQSLRRRFPSRTILFRVGSGDPPSRNRVVNDLLSSHRSIELVDEQGTTPRGLRRPRDMVAARRIAATPGRPVREPLTLEPTPGAVADVQRLSRIGSGGRRTIPRALAQRVLRGELTLSEALANATGAPPSPVEPTPRPAPAPERQRD